MSAVTTTRVGSGAYRVDEDGRAEIVYVAGSGDDWWAFWNGQVFRGGPPDEPPRSHRRTETEAALSLTAPMPATVITVLVEPGSIVRRGETVVVLEAMKMEMPIRAADDGVVSRVRCRPGELVQTGAVLVDLE